MSEPMAADSTVDAGAISPDSVGDRSTTATESGLTLESAVTKTTPMRVRKLRAKAAVSHKINPDRPTLRLKASSAPQKAPNELGQSLGAEADAVEGDSFLLTGTSGLVPPDEQPASPQQIEIPELRPSPRADFDESHAVSPNGALQEAAVTSPPISAPSEEPSQTNGSLLNEPAGVDRDDLIAGSPPSEPQVENAELQTRQEAADASEAFAPQERIATESEPPARGQDHWHSPASKVDPRFTYAPRQDNEQFPIEERLDSRMDVAEPDSVETRPDDRIRRSSRGHRSTSQVAETRPENAIGPSRIGADPCRKRSGIPLRMVKSHALCRAERNCRECCFNGLEQSGAVPRNPACRCKSADNSGTHCRNDQDSVARSGKRRQSRTYRFK